MNLQRVFRLPYRSLVTNGAEMSNRSWSRTALPIPEFDVVLYNIGASSTGHGFDPTPPQKTTPRNIGVQGQKAAPISPMAGTVQKTPFTPP